MGDSHCERNQKKEKKMSNELRGWVATKMEMALGFSDSSLVATIMAIDNEPEATAYMRNFFGDNQPLINEFIRKRFPPKKTGQTNQRKQHQKGREFRESALPITSKKKKGKKDRNANLSVETQMAPTHRPKSPETPQSAAALSAALFGIGDEVVEVIPEPIEEVGPPKPVLQGKWAKKQEKPKKQQRDTNFQMPSGFVEKKPSQPARARKKKYRNINDGSVNLLPGRHLCDCQAQKCDLIANCLACGRIICAQEGEGPCLFCGALVTESSNATNAAYNDQLQRAVDHKNRLLDYDRQSARRTEVVDDETDYYRGVDEEKVREHRHGSRLDKKFSLNLKTETLDEQSTEQYIVTEAQKLAPKVDQERLNLKEQLFYNEDLKSSRFIFDLKNKAIFKETEVIREVIQWGGKSASALANSDRNKRPIKSRVQDERLKEMFDSGTCLTMHQPWAGLLIKGVKIHEGRVWNSAHRGRLWIHAASAEPDPALVADQLARYGMEAADFDHWPQSCLLGFCTVTDVLAQEEYRKQFPDGSSNSPYVFICEDFHELEYKPQLSGQHKLWRLPRDVHQSARAQLNL